jgi:hypothetical protein
MIMNVITIRDPSIVVLISLSLEKKLIIRPIKKPEAQKPTASSIDPVNRNSE